MQSLFFQGFGLSAGLIIAIGAQNAFVLSQSVRRNRPLLIALICASADVLLIALGLTGVGSVVASSPRLAAWAAWGGALFLIVYGAAALRSALRGAALEPDHDALPGLRELLLGTLAVTFLNPHAYLDTLVLIGSIGGQYPLEQRWIFGSGAVAASLAWFLLLALGGPLLAPLFRRPISWRLLDAGVCVVMWRIAFGLLRDRWPLM
ncbi:amino acid transporter [Geothermobacter hydrogeniphilus]|uniref:Amino acid transporter n=1 Tax=Geothermobacter hydrogeniphilus TaxID=1969733 RepID=A0A2K2HEW2_9BACT|nr:LysE/ArgO family amino acid transporter [Geothermobacter hydrogeniphilus]PNU21828.1 amino acid transporter [Geothermobacter hydrogeniphilus]